MNRGRSPQQAYVTPDDEDRAPHGARMGTHAPPLTLERVGGPDVGQPPTGNKGLVIGLILAGICALSKWLGVEFTDAQSDDAARYLDENWEVLGMGLFAVVAFVSKAVAAVRKGKGGRAL